MADSARPCNTSVAKRGVGKGRVALNSRSNARASSHVARFATERPHGNVCGARAWRLDRDAPGCVQRGIGRAVALHAVGRCRRCVGMCQRPVWQCRIVRRCMANGTGDIGRGDVVAGFDLRQPFCEATMAA